MTRNTRDYPKAAVEVLLPVDFMRLRAAERDASSIFDTQMS